MGQVLAVLAVLVLGAAGCVGPQEVMDEEVCAGSTWTAVARDDASLGFTADEVVAALPSPVAVVWDLVLTPDGERVDATDATPVPFALTALTAVDRVRIVDLPDRPDCRPGEPRRQLVFPLALRATAADGEVLAEGAVELYTSGPDPAEVSPFPDWTLPAELSGAYAAAFDGWWETVQADHPQATGFVVQGVYLSLSGTWADLRVALEVLHDRSDASSASVLWRGVAE